MSEMIERVARAMEPTAWTNWDGWCSLKGYTREQAAEECAQSPTLQTSLDKARAAVEAMREPTDFMCETAAETHNVWGFGASDAKEAYRAMIDAALAVGE